MASGRQALTGVDLLRINTRVLNGAGDLMPIGLRTLDAIHLATAQQLGPDLHQVITYDDRMAQAAALLRIAVAAPK